MSIEITDEQYKAICAYIGVPLDEIESTPKSEMAKVDGLIQGLVDSFDKDQIKQLAEDKGLSVFEWVEFDNDDESTWPDRYKKSSFTITVLDEAGNKVFLNRVTEKWEYDDETGGIANVIYWCELPTLPKEK